MILSYFPIWLLLLFFGVPWLLFVIWLIKKIRKM